MFSNHLPNLPFENSLKNKVLRKIPLIFTKYIFKKYQKGHSSFFYIVLDWFECPTDKFSKLFLPLRIFASHNCMKIVEYFSKKLFKKVWQLQKKQTDCCFYGFGMEHCLNFTNTYCFI